MSSPVSIQESVPGATRGHFEQVAHDLRRVLPAVRGQAQALA